MNSEFTISDIEKVEVNGMTMYKLGNELFLKYSDAVEEVEERKFNWKAILGQFDPNFDPFEELCKNGILHGIKF